jgi:hypothetical protein
MDNRNHVRSLSLIMVALGAISVISARPRPSPEKLVPVPILGASASSSTATQPTQPFVCFTFEVGDELFGPVFKFIPVGSSREVYDMNARAALIELSAREQRPDLLAYAAKRFPSAPSLATVSATPSAAPRPTTEKYMIGDGGGEGTCLTLCYDPDVVGPSDGAVGSPP